MGTLTWTVWLLLAFTTLASNVEVEAVPHHEVDDRRGGYLCGSRDVAKHGCGPKEELSEEQKIILKKIMDYLTVYFHPTATGDFTFNGQRIPIDFIVTSAYIDSKLINSIPVEELWEKIQLYEYYEKKAESEPRTRDISKYEHVTALFIKTCVLDRGSATGRIYIEGVTYDLYSVNYMWKNIENVTTSKIIKEIKTHAKRKRSDVFRRPLPDAPSPIQIRALYVIERFLKTQGSSATGTFLFVGNRISIQFIVWHLVQNGRSVTKLTAKELFGIITAYNHEKEEFYGRHGKEEAVLRDILNYLKFLGDGARGEVTFKSHTLSIDFIMTVVQLQGVDIYSLTVSDLWQIIKMYEIFDKKTVSRPQNRNITDYEIVTLLYAITYLRNDGGVTGQIVIDGVKIQVSYLLNQLKIRGKNFRTVTLDQLYIPLSAYLSTYTPPTRVPLGTQPTEEQTLELRALIDLLKTQRSPAVGSFIFSGYRTSVQFILRYIAQHGLRMDRLSINDLWSIMLLHETNETKHEHLNKCRDRMRDNSTRNKKLRWCKHTEHLNH